MVESDMMVHLDLIEEAAKKVGFLTKREQIRSLTVIQIQEANGQWCTFDPIHQGKDVAKFLWAASRSLGVHNNEMEFRIDFLKEMTKHDYTVSQKR